MTAGRSYLAAVLLLPGLGGCRSALPPVEPTGSFAPLSAAEFAALTARTVPAGPELLSVRWRFVDRTISVSGRGAVRVAPPDSLRIDVRGPLGFGRGTLVLAGDSVWANSEDMVRQLLPDRFLVWAMLGVVRAPAPDVVIEASEAEDRRFVRLTEGDGRATTFELRGDTLVGVLQARGDRPLGRLALRRDVTGRIVRAEADDREREARLVFEIQRRTPSAPFGAEVWRRP